ncbi:MAG TPA: thiolase family protein [Planctomycetota bacterium]|nr:thiolase family protein [Planctomycetota bacterium]
MTRRTVVVAGCRTPFAKSGGRLRSLLASDLGAIAVREALARSPVAPKQVDEVVYGCVGPDATEANPARVLALRAGIPVEKPAVTVNRNCASGMESLLEASRRIALGEADVVVAGGAEAMSRYPLSYGPEATVLFEKLARAKTVGARLATLAKFRPRHLKPRIALVEGLTDPTCGLNMGETAELVAREAHVSREEQDLFALRSHQRASAAEREGRLAEEIAPVVLPTEMLDRDDGIRHEQSIEQLRKLRPLFDRRTGTITAGNSCQITDGAVALVLASEERARAEGWPVLGRLEAAAVRGLDPAHMGLGPVHAIQALLEKTGRAVGDVDAYEINEAFAAQVIACLRSLVVDEAKLNREGGAIALGHPVGASGARLVLTLLLQMRRRGERSGIASLCVGGGQGVAVLLER